MGDANLLGPAPQQTSLFGAFSLLDASGRHSLRLQAALREYTKVSMPLKLKTTKASLGYRFLSDTRFAADDGGGASCSIFAPGDLRAASVELALGGMLGDVAFARTQGMWTRSRRVLGGGLFSL